MRTMGQGIAKEIKGMGLKTWLRASLRHADAEQRSTVTVGFLIISLTLYLCVAGVWNTGALVEQKMQTQAAADAAAQAAAVKMSSALNQVAMLNMLQLRARSAQVIGTNCIVLSTTGLAAATALEASYIAQVASSLGLNIYADIQAVLTGIDIARLIAFTIKHSKAKRGDIGKVVTKCQKAKKKVIGDLGKDINKKMKQIEAYLPEGVSGGKPYRLYLAHPGGNLYPGTPASGDKLVFKKSDYGSRLAILAARVVLADMQWATVKNPFKPPAPQASYKFPGLRSQKFFSGFRSKKLPPILRGLWYAGLAGSILGYSAGDWGYDLKSRSALQEWSGGNPANRKLLQVVAVAERSASSDSFMAAGFFKPVNAGDSVVAMAQAEAGNVYDELFFGIGGSIPILKNIVALPWRMWSSMGANYQGRLSLLNASTVSDALGHNKKMQKCLKDNTGQAVPVTAGSRNVFLH